MVLHCHIVRLHETISTKAAHLITETADGRLSSRILFTPEEMARAAMFVKVMKELDDNFSYRYEEEQ